jgi:ligand-binding sensor domain-containing protein/signal transduction histidine kinase/DNA-binding response OmpR family regulator
MKMIHNKIIRILLHSIFIPFLYTAAQPNMVFKHFSTENGLSESTVQCILQDRFGFLWFGSEDGLNQFDGYRFSVYRPVIGDSTSLCGNFITSILEDRSGNLWIGTANGGLNLFNRHHRAFVRCLDDSSPKTTAKKRSVHCMLEDRKGRLWIGSDDGLDLVDAAHRRYLQYPPLRAFQDSLPAANVTALFEDIRGTLWIGTVGHGLILLDPENGDFIRYHRKADDPASLSHDHVQTIAEDASGRVWVGLYGGGLNLFDRRTGGFVHFRYRPDTRTSIGSDNVFTLYRDRRGVLWIGTDTGGLNRMVEKTDQGLHRFDFIRIVCHNDDPLSLSTNNIRSIIEDRVGNLWIGTFKGGINFVDRHRKQFLHYKNLAKDERSLGHNLVNTVFEDSEGRLWIGTDGGGLNRFRRETGTFTRFIPREGDNRSLSNDHVLAICEDHGRRLWVGTWGGLNCLAGEGGVFDRYLHDPLRDNSLICDNVTALLNDSRGLLWICTYEGLDLFDPHRRLFRHLLPDKTNPRTLTHEWVKAACEDRLGNVWIGTASGLNFIPRTDIESNRLQSIHYLCDAGVSGRTFGKMVNSIYETRNGQIWVGTMEGLCRFDSAADTFAVFSVLDGLPSDCVLGIQEDGSGNLWLSTMNGLSRFDPAGRRFVNYDFSDGLQNNQFTVAACRSRTGEIYFGGINGFNVFHPDSIRINPIPPPVVITDFRIFNRLVPMVDYAAGRSVSKIGQDPVERIELSYRNVFSFEFAALNYTSPEKNRYAYRMEGFSRNWIATDAKNRVATYTNLPGGDYVFRVKASNNDGVWNEDGASISIRIVPPVWKTPWALVVYVLSAAGLLVLLRRIILMKERYEAKLALDQMKLRFFTNISHEFQTPLTLIIGPVEKMIQAGRDFSRTQQQHYHQIMLRNARRLLRLVNQILDIRKLESGKMPLEIVHTDIVKYIRKIADSFRYQSENRRMEFHVHAGQRTIEAWFDPDKVEKIVYNLLSNAFKHTPDGGRIEAFVDLFPSKSAWLAIARNRGGPRPPKNPLPMRSRKDPVIAVTVQDSGCGIPADRIPHVFDLFYQAENAAVPGPEGVGIGLALTKELVELHGGEIRVESEEGHGTRFTVLLKGGNPLRRQPAGREESFWPKVRRKLRPDIPDRGEWAPPGMQGADAENTAEDGGDAPLVLVVEDDADLRAFIRDELKGDYRIVESADGNTGFGIAVERIPDLIVSDIRMPGMDGITLSARLKHDERTSHVPVVLLTALASERKQREGFESGVDDYIVKPFNAALLRLRVKNLIESRRRLRERYSREIRLEPERISVTPADETFLRRAMQAVEKHLAEPEFDVEEFGREMALSRSQLYRKFMGLINETPRDFIRIMRLKRASQMIESGGMTVSEISFAVGFKDPAYFSTAFKKHFRKSPSEWGPKDRSPKS